MANDWYLYNTFLLSLNTQRAFCWNLHSHAHSYTFILTPLSAFQFSHTHCDGGIRGNLGFSMYLLSHSQYICVSTSVGQYRMTDTLANQYISWTLLQRLRDVRSLMIDYQRDIPFCLKPAWNLYRIFQKKQFFLTIVQ